MLPNDLLRSWNCITFFFGIHAIVQSKIDVSPLNGTLGDLPNARMKSGNALPTL
jgi:hypothetical protein